ncbi:hypothetical protein [Parasutterella excrementihominis]
MANDVSIFASAPLPAYLAQTNVEALNGDITAHASLSFPVLSLNVSLSFAATKRKW